MSNYKTFMSRGFYMPFNLEGLSPLDRNEVEKSLDFTVGQRLSAIRNRIGPDKFVHVCGKSGKQVSRYLKGDAPPLAVLHSISAETLVSIEWLAKGVVSTSADKNFEKEMLTSEGVSRYLFARTPKPEPLWSKTGYGLDLIDKRLEALEMMPVIDLPASTTAHTLEVTDPPKVPNFKRADMFTIPRYDEVRPSAGNGSITVSEIPTTRIAVEQGWLAELGVRIDAAVILPAQGDSMEPTIMNGAPMLVDTSKKEVRNGFIYVFDVAGDLMVKRIERLPDGTINLLSDNSGKYPPRTLDREAVARMTVIGRVYAAVSKF